MQAGTPHEAARAALAWFNGPSSDVERSLVENDFMLLLHTAKDGQTQGHFFRLFDNFGLGTGLEHMGCDIRRFTADDGRQVTTYRVMAPKEPSA